MNNGGRKYRKDNTEIFESVLINCKSIWKFGVETPKHAATMTKT